MKKENVNNLSEEIRKIKYHIDYKINETPKYRPLVGANEEFDEIPQLTNEAGEQENVPKPAGGATGVVSTNTNTPTNAGIPAKTPVPAFDKTNNKPPVPDGDKLPTNSIGTTLVEPSGQIDDIQNEIIRHNIKAMKSIHDQLEGLNAMVMKLNAKLEQLNTDVEEVREPTNTEKLMNKTSVSYPYYFNLNDFWSGNWFNEKRNQEKEKGIKELPDGTFVADFDDLPRKSKIDIQNSFNEIT